MYSPASPELHSPPGEAAARGRLALTVGLLLPVAAGALNVFAFAPFKGWPLQIVALAWLFHGVLARPQASVRGHFLRG